jgi:hypothetical protein
MPNKLALASRSCLHNAVPREVIFLGKLEDLGVCLTGAELSRHEVQPGANFPLADLTPEAHNVTGTTEWWEMARAIYAAR